MKKMRMITCIAILATVFTGCGNETLVSDSSIDTSVTTTATAVSEATTAETTAAATAADSTATTAEATTASTAASTSAESKPADAATTSNTTQTEHRADDPANQGGHAPTYEMEQYAVNDIDALNRVLEFYGGKGIECDESDTVTADIGGETIVFSKVTETFMLNFMNTEDVKNYMKLALPEKEYTNYMADFDRHFRDENGCLYMNTNVGRAFYHFSCDTEDMIFTDITDNSFTVTYKEADPMFGMGYVYFRNEGDRWHLSGFEFK